jgi:creatinine amidohydrolase
MPETFETMNWMDVERYLQGDDRIVLVVGSCEQHGYLSLLADTLIPMAIAREACRREGVLLAPALPFGVSPYFTAFPGTLSLRPETLAIVFREIVEGLLGQGFRGILVSNGHGGNSGVLSPVLVEIGTAHADARLNLWHSWRDAAVVAVAQATGYPQYHANWQENFAFTRVGPLPTGGKEPPQIPASASAQAVRQILGDGSFGGPYQAPPEVSDRFFAAAVDAMAAEIRALSAAERTHQGKAQ